jgi:hypothetical protein
MIWGFVALAEAWAGQNINEAKSFIDEGRKISHWGKM